MHIINNCFQLNQKTLDKKFLKSKNVYYLSFLIVFFILVFYALNYFNYSNYYSSSYSLNEKVKLDLVNIPKVILDSDEQLIENTNLNCSFWDCFNVYRCGGQKNNGKISVYVYPLKNYVNAKGKKAFNLTKEFYIILKTIIDSPYYTSNPNEACLFVPSIDTLNLMDGDVQLVSKALASLSNWENGENHLLFNMIGSSDIELNTANALLASANLDTWSYRMGFDISLPFYSPTLSNIKTSKFTENEERPFTLIASSLILTSRQINVLQEISFNQPKILLLQNCGKNYHQSEISTQFTSNINSLNDNDDGMLCSYPSKDIYEYPNVLMSGDFCLVTLDGRLNQFTLLEAVASNCIPILIDNIRVLPFNEIIDWKLASIKINHKNLDSIITVLSKVSLDKKLELKKQLRWLYEKYFCSLEKIIETMLDELNNRIQPHSSKTYLDWNIPKLPKSTLNPLFLPIIAPKTQGFTAVILTYDRIESLMTLVQKLSVVPSLQKILIIWNNQKKAPPHLAMFQKISKPLKIIQTKENKLSNRFYPYEEIETEAILTIDDDIIMLTTDELDFGYEVWREFPDRIVGFPSRTHVWDNITNKWTYESEWTNQISMVLTGAAFHHKFWSYMYTNSMPGNIKEWVDEKMNCEDIAMNFLVANITNKPPIKVAPRKKFKCPECTNSEMLSADINHMMERSACIDRFAQIYGSMPLKSVEFRADPVLYKDNFPEKLKRFNDIGSL